MHQVKEPHYRLFFYGQSKAFHLEFKRGNCLAFFVKRTNALNAIRYFPNAIKSFIFEFEQFVFKKLLLQTLLSSTYYYFKHFFLLKISNVHVISFYKKHLYKK